MNSEQLEAIVRRGLPASDVVAEGEGDHFVLEVVDNQFAGMPRVKRQQLIYACVNSYIMNGEIHALSIRAFSPAERQQNRDY